MICPGDQRPSSISLSNFFCNWKYTGVGSPLNLFLAIEVRFSAKAVDPDRKNYQI
jgi:hypothetical protein